MEWAVVDVAARGPATGVRSLPDGRLSLTPRGDGGTIQVIQSESGQTCTAGRRRGADFLVDTYDNNMIFYPFTNTQTDVQSPRSATTPHQIITVKLG